MSHDSYTLEELARQLGRDRREIEKLVQRGRIPGRKVGGEWQFHQVEITRWLEREMREYTDSQLAAVEESQESTEADAEVPVSSLLRPETVQVPLEARTKRSVLESLVEVAGRTWQVWEPATVLEAVRQREEAYSTAFESGVAIPHPRDPLPDALEQSIIAYGRTLSPVPFGGRQGGLTDIFFLVLCRDARTHLRVLARLGRMIRQPEFLSELRAVDDSEMSYRVICEADRALGRE